MNLVSRISAPRAVLFGFLLTLPLGAWAQTAGAHPDTELSPDRITYLTEDFPASNFLDHGVLKGIAVDLLKVIWRKLGVPPQPVQVMNWARAFDQTQRTPNTMLFAMARNAERESKFLWVGPIYRNRYALYGKVKERIALHALRDAAAYRVGVIRQDSGHHLLSEAGVPEEHIEQVAHSEQLIRMLEAGRVDLICISVDTYQSFLKSGMFDPSTYRMAVAVPEIELYFAFNPTTDPRLVARFQKALKDSDAERIRIVKSYGGIP